MIPSLYGPFSSESISSVRYTFTFAIWQSLHITIFPTGLPVSSLISVFVD